jgi:hypothetical protein
LIQIALLGYIPGMAKKGQRKMISVKEVAIRLGVAEVSVRMWARKGRLPGAELIDPPVGIPYWMIPEESLSGFEMSKPGPKPGAKKAKRDAQNN